MAQLPVRAPVRLSATQVAFADARGRRVEGVADVADGDVTGLSDQLVRVVGVQAGQFPHPAGQVDAADPDRVLQRAGAATE